MASTVVPRALIGVATHPTQGLWTVLKPDAGGKARQIRCLARNLKSFRPTLPESGGLDAIPRNPTRRRGEGRAGRSSTCRRWCGHMRAEPRGDVHRSGPSPGGAHGSPRPWRVRTRIRLVDFDHPGRPRGTVLESGSRVRRRTALRVGKPGRAATTSLWVVVGLGRYEVQQVEFRPGSARSRPRYRMPCKSRIRTVRCSNTTVQ